jgi:hypothetical protein
MIAQPAYIMGDVHGQLAKVIPLLAGAGLIDPDGRWTGGALWTGGAATLWFLGDFVDRGPAGLGAVDLVMRLQREAAAVGGRVGALLGNHDMLLLAAHHFGDTPIDPWGTVRQAWELDGGVAADLAGLTPAHVAWMQALPAMAYCGDHLLVHADALFYYEYGASVAAVNDAFARLLAGDDLTAWHRLLDQFGEHRAFHARREDGTDNARAFLARYGGRRLIHGHTPIDAMTGQPPATVTGPLTYADGLCVNCDGGMYRGGPGFVYRVPGRDR